MSDVDGRGRLTSFASWSSGIASPAGDETAGPTATNSSLDAGPPHPLAASAPSMRASTTDGRHGRPRLTRGRSVLELSLQRIKGALVGALHHLRHGVVGVDVPCHDRRVADRRHCDRRLVFLELDGAADVAVGERAGGVVVAVFTLGDLCLLYTSDAADE